MGLRLEQVTAELTGAFIVVTSSGPSQICYICYSLWFFFNTYLQFTCPQTKHLGSLLSEMTLDAWPRVETIYQLQSLMRGRPSQSCLNMAMTLYSTDKELQVLFNHQMVPSSCRKMDKTWDVSTELLTHMVDEMFSGMDCDWEVVPYSLLWRILWRGAL